jgi:predicted phosphodiesterase
MVDDEILEDKLNPKLLTRLSNLSDKERKILLKQLGGVDRSAILRHRHHYPTNHAKFGYISDWHVGHKAFREDVFVKAMRLFKREGIDTVYSPGDMMEGMSGRPGHVYELNHIGFTAQADYLEQLITAFPDVHIFGIDGNHDEWYQNKNDTGLVVGETIEQRCSNYHNLGQMEAVVELSPSVDLLLYHGRDGTAYATSYKMQKLMESFTGGQKPNVILSGHYHKHLTMWNRNIFGVEAGTLCGQTPFMRGKKIPAHVGFGIIDVWYNSKGASRVDHTFFPEFDLK